MSIQEEQLHTMQDGFDQNQEELFISGVVKPLKAMEEATIIDYCNEIIEIFELPNHSNNAWKKEILENAIVKMKEVLENF